MNVQESVAFFKELKRLSKGYDPIQFKKMVEDSLDEMPNTTIAERVSVKRVMEALFEEEKKVKMRQVSEAICYNYFQGVKSKRINEHMVH